MPSSNRLRGDTTTKEKNSSRDETVYILRLVLLGRSDVDVASSASVGIPGAAYVDAVA